MNGINFDTGKKTYTINDACEVSFSPTDAAFAESLYNAFEQLSKMQAEHQKEAERVKGNSELFILARKRDKEMRDIIDGILGPVSDKLFGAMNCYSLANGFPAWANLLVAIMDEMDQSIVRERKLTNPRVDKYIKKYHK